MIIVPVAPPQNVTFLKVSAHSVSLSWAPPPREHQNGNITGYVLMLYMNSEVKQLKQTAHTTVTISALSGNTHYVLTISAKTNIGMSPVAFKTKIYGKM